MKNWKKLLICILISMMVTSFVGLEVNKIYTSYVIDFIGDNSEIFKDTVGVTAGESLRNAALGWKETSRVNSDETISEEPENEIDVKYLGLVYEIYTYINSLSFYGLYYMLLLFGVLVGVVAYFIFVKQVKISKLSLLFMIGLEILLELYYINVYEILFSEAGLLYCLAIYVVLVALFYIINFCMQKRISKQPKEELKKD